MINPGFLKLQGRIFVGIALIFLVIGTALLSVELNALQMIFVVFCSWIFGTIIIWVASKVLY